MILHDPIWNNKCRKHGETKYKDIPRRIHICGLPCKMCQQNTDSSKNVNDLKKKDLARLFTCRLEIPAAPMTPNMIMNIPPITGVGMVVKIAPIFPRIPIKIMTNPLRRITVRLPTCCQMKHHAVHMFCPGNQDPQPHS